MAGTSAATAKERQGEANGLERPYRRRHGRAYPRARRQVLQGLHRPRIPRAVQPAVRGGRAAGGERRPLRAVRQHHRRHRADRGRPRARRARHFRDHLALRDGARPQGVSAGPQGPAAADPPRGQLGLEGAARGHGPRPCRRRTCCSRRMCRAIARCAMSGSRTRSTAPITAGSSISAPRRRSG